MQYYNLIFCKRNENDPHACVYQMPLNKSAEAGDKLFVRDRLGEHVMLAVSENHMVGYHLAKDITKFMGGYFPPAWIIGTVGTVTVTREVAERYDDNDAPDLATTVANALEGEDIPF